MNSDFPRSIRLGRHQIGTYKICLLAGIYFGIVASAVAAKVSGTPPTATALATLACAVAGLVGARLYHLVLFAGSYRREDFRRAWDTSAGGGGLFGGLLAVILVSPAAARWPAISFGEFWDLLIPALLVGAVWTRLGCFCHGCCGGRGTVSRLGFRWSNQRGERARRVPVQLLEIAWVLVAIGVVAWSLSRPHRAGSLALGAMAWYGLGRFLLEPFREAPDLIRGKLRINQLIAAVLTITATALLLRR